MKKYLFSSKKIIIHSVKDILILHTFFSQTSLSLAPKNRSLISPIYDFQSELIPVSQKYIQKLFLVLKIVYKSSLVVLLDSIFFCSNSNLEYTYLFKDALLLIISQYFDMYVRSSNFQSKSIAFKFRFLYSFFQLFLIVL